MNILICTTQVPFTTGGAEAHVEGLRRALVEAGHQAEIVALPFKWYPPSEIMRGALAWRLLDLTEANGKPVDLVIGMKFPAYLVAHPRKVLWIMHQYRAAYNLWDTPFDDLSQYPDGAQVREWIRQADSRLIPQAKKVLRTHKPSLIACVVTTTSTVNRFITRRRARKISAAAIRAITSSIPAASSRRSARSF
jgi:hypothetical protein